jgi:hypothetical protein
MTRITISGRLWPTAVLLALAAIAIGAVFGVARTGQAAIAVVPSETTPPTISGTLQVGSTLTATDGVWSGTAPITYTHAWQRCDENGGSCSLIGGATANTYVLKQVDAGTTLRAMVTAKNNDGSAQSTSVPTGVIGSTSGTGTGCPSGTGAIPIAELSPPGRLLIDQQVTSPSLIRASTNQIIAHFRVTACGGRPVEGALLFVTVVPYDQFGGKEAATAADGTVNLTLDRQKSFPATPKQRLLVMFARARAPGADVLGGVSTRRLVSFPVTLAG